MEKAVGELTLAYVLNLLRKILIQDKNMCGQKFWKKPVLLRLLIRPLVSLDMEKLENTSQMRYLNHLVSKLYGVNDVRKINIKNKVSLKTITKKSNIITIHSNYTKKNYKLVNKQYLKLFKTIYFCS